MAKPSFADDIKPLFRERDRSSMLHRFDLWSYQDVRDNAEDIVAVLRSGSMPCDGPWGSDDIERFASWMAEGMAK